MRPPFNFKKWVDENRASLKPPVGNKQVFEDGDFIIMAVGGPNTRKDYHDDPGEEFFFQIEGDMVLRVMENGQPRDIEIREGDMFLLPSHVHHSPQRKENTVGLVVERKRQPGELDGFLWYCDECHAKLHDEYFQMQSIVTDLPRAFDRFWDNEQARTCKSCGHMMPLPASRQKRPA
ncbi:MAG TPA: 3-hydroxyanthranilate 3,4-dioxygenase [Patescibacteria group bacterium]|nr:3-hydroxyanthranilate 3,4-dioxygenase [Patescibacteria group bacterium]